MTRVMARMKLLFSLPFCFLLTYSTYAQGVKKLASGEEHADTLNYQVPSATISIPDTTKKDSVAISETSVLRRDSIPKQAGIKQDTVKKQPRYTYPVPIYLEIGLSGNSYRGDLSETYRSFSPSFHLGIQLNRRRWLNGYFGVSLGQVNGTADAPYTSSTDASVLSNAYFNTIFFTAKYELYFNIVKNNWITAYVGLGIGFLNFTPYDLDSKSLVGQGSTRAKNESYTSNSAIFPLSAGVRFSLKNHWAIHLQASLLNQTTAYIDNVSTLSTNPRGDNILALKFAVLVPLKINK